MPNPLENKLPWFGGLVKSLTGNAVKNFTISICSSNGWCFDLRKLFD
ncbi:hypothetical protein G7B40_028760 [Aetokthonos hydrillicola Thurmond2011]|uniref:Uncharacterized protein n=1 Tax=Aetokthonos hydrillicola Thurmond2011 TaxID=2712845 RepID=A0AAP5MBY2_9CYAN|nr:hypothetical protein [Aetokthonos hydrillicola Thurmond2011]